MANFVTQWPKCSSDELLLLQNALIVQSDWNSGHSDPHTWSPFPRAFDVCFGGKTVYVGLMVSKKGPHECWDPGTLEKKLK